MEYNFPPEPTADVTNRLRQIDLRDAFHHQVNDHIDLHQRFFNPNLYDVYNLNYFCQFLLGIFVSIRSSSHSNLKEVYIRKKTIDNIDGNSLRIFAVFNDLIVLHDIQIKFSELGPETKMMTNQEYSLLKDLIKDKHNIAIDQLDMKYKQYGAGPVKDKQCWQMNIKHEMNIQVRDGTTLNGHIKMRMEHKLLDEEEISVKLFKKLELEFIEVRELVSSFFDTFTSADKRASHFYWLQENFLDANHMFQRMNSHHHVLYERTAQASFMHGLLSCSMPDHFYNKAMQFDRKFQNYLPQIPTGLIFIPLINPQADPERIIMMDFRYFKNTENDHLLACEMGRNVELHLWRPSNEGPTTLRKEVIKWNSAHLISNLVQDIKMLQSNGNFEAFETKTDLHLNLLKVRTDQLLYSSAISDPDLYKYCLMGEFITSLDRKFYISMDGSRLEAIIIEYDETKVLLTFDADGPIGVHRGLDNVVHRPGSDVIGINLRNNDASFFIVDLDEAVRIYNDFQPVFPIGIKQFFNRMSFNDYLETHQSSLLPEFQAVMDGLLKNAKNFATNENAVNAYLCGIFSQFSQYGWQMQLYNGLNFFRIGIETATKVDIYIHFLLMNDANKRTYHELHNLVSRMVSRHHSVYIGYNFAEERNLQRYRLAIATLAVEGLHAIDIPRKLISHLTSRKMRSVCKLLGGGRRKRAMGTEITCPALQERQKRLTYQDFEKKLATKHPYLHKHVTKIYNVATRIQTAIIGGSMLSHLLGGDFKAFGIDVAFLGAAVASPYAAERIAKWGEKKVIKFVEKGSTSKSIIQTVIKKIGWRIATVGRCLPTLGFTAFSAYQLHQEIKNNDTVSAAITGASLAIDIIGCGFEAAAAVGLLAISPIIVKIGLIVSTALAIAQNIYSGFRQTQQIGEVIPLTLSEKYYSFKRSVIPWLDADPTLKSMADQVVANEQAVATAFHMFPEVNRFLLAAATRVDDETGLVSYHENNTMDMTKRKHKVQVSRAMPRQEQIGTDYSLFCAMDEKHVVGREELKQKMSWSSMATFGFPEIVMAIINHLTTEKRPQVDDYRCVNAFGVNRVNSSSSDTTIFLLYNGADDVVGFPDSPNVMILGNGKKKIYGGQKDDHFVMNGIHTYGYLDGGSGEDVIDFSEYAKDPTIVMNFENSMVSLSRSNHKFDPIIVKNIENFIGRPHSTDHVEVCNHTSIDLRGSGSSFDADIVIVSHSEKCQPITNLTVHLKNNTNVVCDAENATVIYMVTRDTLNLLDIPVGSHHFIFNLVTLPELHATMNDTSLTLLIGSTGQLDIEASEAADLKFTFNAEKITMTINQGKLVALVSNTASLYETVENYASYLKKNPLIVLIAKTSYGNIKLGSDHSTIEKNGVHSNFNIVFFDDTTNKQKLVAHSDGENYFLIHKKLENDINEALNITIDASHAKKFKSYLDLKYFCAARKENSDFDIKMVAAQDENNIIITVVAVPVNDVDNLAETEMGTVLIIDGMTYMDQITINLWSESQIINSSNELLIRPIPKHVDQYVYSIHPDQLEFNSTIYFNFEIGHLEAYSINNSLIITDAALLENQEKKCVILTFIEFYVFKQKYETLILIFENRKISLSSEFVKTAVDMSLMWGRMDERLENVEQEEKEESDLLCRSFLKRRKKRLGLN